MPRPTDVTARGGYLVGISGESYRQDAISRTSVGEKVILAHDTENVHDPRAIAVLNARYEQIGFLPRGGWLTGALIDEGEGYKAHVSAIYEPDRQRRFAAVVLEVKLGRS